MRQSQHVDFAISFTICSHFLTDVFVVFCHLALQSVTWLNAKRCHAIAHAIRLLYAAKFQPDKVMYTYVYIIVFTTQSMHTSVNNNPGP